MKATSFSSSISANLGNFGEAMVEIHKYSVGSCIVDSSTSVERTPVAQIPGRWGVARAAHAQFYHMTIRRMTKILYIQCCQSIYVYSCLERVCDL